MGTHLPNSEAQEKHPFHYIHSITFTARAFKHDNHKNQAEPNYNRSQKARTPHKMNDRTQNNKARHFFPKKKERARITSSPFLSAAKRQDCELYLLSSQISKFPRSASAKRRGTWVVAVSPAVPTASFHLLGWLLGQESRLEGDDPVQERNCAEMRERIKRHGYWHEGKSKWDGQIAIKKP